MNARQRTAISPSFDNPGEKYVQYNFQRADWLDELRDRLCGSPSADSRVVILEGPAGIGRKYFVSAAAFAR